MTVQLYWISNIFCEWRMYAWQKKCIESKPSYDIKNIWQVSLKAFMNWRDNNSISGSRKHLSISKMIWLNDGLVWASSHSILIFNIWNLYHYKVVSTAWVQRAFYHSNFSRYYWKCNSMKIYWLDNEIIYKPCRMVFKFIRYLGIDQVSYLK